VGNAVTRSDHNNNFMLDKSKSTQRIDPIVSIITAFTRALTSDISGQEQGFGVMFI
jgi:phage terminase large subunit-like protein